MIIYLTYTSLVAEFEGIKRTNSKVAARIAPIDRRNRLIDEATGVQAVTIRVPDLESLK